MLLGIRSRDPKERNPNRIFFPFFARTQFLPALAVCIPLVLQKLSFVFPSGLVLRHIKFIIQFFCFLSSKCCRGIKFMSNLRYITKAKWTRRNDFLIDFEEYVQGEPAFRWAILNQKKPFWQRLGSFCTQYEPFWASRCNLCVGI